MDGLSVFLDELSIPSLLLWTTLGVVVSLVLSALPGLSGTIAVVILLPLGLDLSLIDCLGMLIGAFKAAQFGGSVTSATLNIPGSPEAAAATKDLFGLSRKGYPRKALGFSLHSGTVADLFSNLLVILLLPTLALIALQFGTAELLAVSLLAVFVLPTAASAPPTKTLIAIFLGFLISMVGFDPLSGQSRLTFGLDALRGGIYVIPLVVGLLAMSVVIGQLSALVAGRRHATGEVQDPITSKPDDRFRWKELWKVRRELALGTFLGSLIGILPGPGGTTAAFASYGIAARMKGNKAIFGTGAPGGIVAPEAANNATVGPAFVPLLAFGVPGSAIAGVIAGAFIMHGLTPGPGLFNSSPETLYAFLAVLMVASLLNWPLGALFSRFFGLVPRIPIEGMMVFIFIVIVVATYISRNSVNDVMLMLVFGVIGFLMSKYGFPVPILIVAYLIGPLIESNLRRGLQVSGGDWTYFVTSPGAIVIYAGTAVLMAVLIILRRRQPKESATKDKEDELEMTGID